MNTIRDIIDAAASLPPSERAQLIPLLWDQLAPEEWAHPSSAWLDELNRRSNLIERGEMKVEDWSQVRERALKKAGLIK